MSSPTVTWRKTLRVFSPFGRYRQRILGVCYARGSRTRTQSAWGLPEGPAWSSVSTYPRVPDALHYWLHSCSERDRESHHEDRNRSSLENQTGAGIYLLLALKWDYQQTKVAGGRNVSLCVEMIVDTLILFVIEGWILEHLLSSFRKDTASHQTQHSQESFLVKVKVPNCARCRSHQPQRLRV